MSARAQAAVLVLLFALVLASRLTQLHILWAEESYPTAAARELLHGKILYRDVWFDKPPLYAMIYLLWDAGTGFALRWSGALFMVLIISIGYRFALDLWGREAALAAASLLGIYLTFGIPSAVMALAPDLLMMAPHLAAVYLAWRGNAFGAGLAAGAGLLVNPKGVLVLLVCLLWQWRKAHWLLTGFVLPNLIMWLYLADNGAWRDSRRQIWEWGMLYSRDTFIEHPVREGVQRTLNWLGFQGAAVVGAVWFFVRGRESARWRYAIWLLLALAGVAAGWRFFPRYYFLPLAPLCILGARGLTIMPRQARMAAVLLLLIPIVRFGTRYVLLAEDLALGRPHQWSDLAMNDDSRDAASLLRGMAHSGDTLLVWGYRADIYVYSGVPAGTRFLDSQPLTGVLADRHLTNSTPTAPEWAAENRRELMRARPTWIVDGLGPYNPALAMDRFDDLRDWLAQYEVKGRTSHSIIYRLR